MKPWLFPNRRKPQPVSGDIDPQRVRIASPCTASWQEMKGNDWVRHCTECNLKVYNFSELTWKEVESLIARHQGRLCARIYRRADGTVLTQDCPKGLQAVVRRVSRWAGAALSAMAVVNSAGAQSSSGRDPNPLVQIKSAAQTKEKVGENSATVVMEVVDQQGAVIAFARVLLMNQVSGQSWEANTDRKGRARLGGLGRDRYKLRVDANGFRTYQQEVDLTSLEMAEMKVTLQVGEAGGVFVEPASVSTEQVPSQNNLQQIPVTPIPEPRRKNPHRKKSEAKTQAPAGTANPPIFPHAGQRGSGDRVIRNASAHLR